MQIDLSAHIEKLLFLHDTLTIPEFGGFTASKTSAAVDYAGGTVAPPGKTLNFSENLTVDDGILVDDIAKTHGISTDEAREAVRKYVEQVQQQLSQREIVTLPGVGRLYRNYVQKIQFLPDATNFHAGSYGLPPLQFSPIARSRDVAEKPAAATGGTAVATPPPPASEPVKTATIPPLPPPPNFVSEPYQAPRTSATRFGTIIGIGLILCTVAFGIWWWQFKKDQSAANTAIETSDESNVSAAPLSGVTDLAKMAEKDNSTKNQETPAQPEQEDKDLNDEVEPAATARAAELLRRQNEAPVSRTEKGRTCTLIIATLQDSNNADRLIAKLEGAGYDVYHRQQRGHQVGIQFRYTNQREIDEKREELIRFTGEKGIFVKK